MSEYNATRHSHAASSGVGRDQRPDLYLPAMPPLDLMRRIGRVIDAWRYRRHLTRLLGYDDHMLDDMGHSRAELLMALKLPLTADARAAIREWQAERRRTG